MPESDRFQSLLDLRTSLARDIPEFFRKELRLVRAQASEALGLLLTAFSRLAVGHGAGQDLASSLGHTLSANPVPTALVGVGLPSLLLAPKASAPPRAADSAEAVTPKGHQA